MKVPTGPLALTDELSRRLHGVAGVYVGGCVERGEGSSFRASGHAHTARGPHQGWVCIRSTRRILTARGNPSRILMHEYVHVLTGHGHDDLWREYMRRLGQPIERRYERRTRGRRNGN